MTVQTMSGSRRRSSSSKGRSQELDWDAIEDPDCVAEPGWQVETRTPWTCTTCKAYVKMKHLAKLWPRSQAVISVPRWEGPTESCTSDHFRQRYFEIHTAAGLPCSKPKMMNYSNMAMVWAEIVLHKDVDWRTVYGRNVSGLNRDLWMIPTNWIGPSDCWPRWSNRMSNSGMYGAPATTGPHEHPSHGEEYNPYRTVANDPPQTFSTTHEGGSHGYDYNPYHSVGNDPPATFTVPHGGPSHGYDYSPYHTPGNDPHPSFGMAHEGRSYGYDHRPHNTASNTPPPTFGYAHEQPSHYSDHNPYYSVTNDPPPTFCPHVTSRDREEEEYQRQLEEATRQSQADYTRKLEEDNRFYSAQWDAIHHLYPGQASGPGGPSRRFDETDSDSDSE
jgi:hypothetical protein